jgi:hypothetical protein
MSTKIGYAHLILLITLIVSGGFLVALSSCTKKSTEPDGYWKYAKMPVDSISVGQVDSTSAAFTLRCWWYNGCGEYSHDSITYNAGTYVIKVVGKEYVRSDIACTQALKKIYAQVQIPLSGPGIYVCKFWRTDSTTMDTTLTVP